MSKRNFVFLVLLFAISYRLSAQQEVDYTSENKIASDSLVSDSLVKKKSPYRFLPRIFLGAGGFIFQGDIKDIEVPGIHMFGNRVGWDAGFSINLSNSLDISLSYLQGKLSGNENGKSYHRNFENKFWNTQINLEYNFYNLIKRQTMLYPFVNIGFAYMNYQVSEDLGSFQDSCNCLLPYYYWPDGMSRVGPPGNYFDTRPAYNDRDYIYEHSVLKSKQTFAIPIGLGIGFNISNKLSFKVGSQYFVSFSDDLDADTKLANNPSDYKGKSGNDGYIYTYARFSFNVYSKKEKINYEDFLFMTYEDLDGDGVIDLYDKCPETPENIETDAWGCPLDFDSDGIPDYLDLEVNTPDSVVTDLYGVTIDKESLDIKEGNPIYRKDLEDYLIEQNPSAYTIHVGTYGRSIPMAFLQKLKTMEGLVETRLNDSTVVYTIGSYNDFKQAQSRQEQLLNEGYDQAFAVKEKKVNAVASSLQPLSPEPTEFKTRKKKEAEEPIPVKAKSIETVKRKDVLTFKVELSGYHVKVALLKLSSYIAKYDVEMVNNGPEDRRFLVGSFENPTEAEEIRREIIKAGLNQAGIRAYLNNQSISLEDALDVYEILHTKN